jgi:hypothetical protein
MATVQLATQQAIWCVRLFHSVSQLGRVQASRAVVQRELAPVPICSITAPAHKGVTDITVCFGQGVHPALVVDAVSIAVS